MRKRQLISAEHQKKYEDYYAHKEIKPRMHPHADLIFALAERVAANTILDYGCGPARALELHSGQHPYIAVRSYDPAVKGIAKLPVQKSDVVFCNHVLEHIEDADSCRLVMQHIFSLARLAAFIEVSTEPSTKQFAEDGTPWHTIVRHWSAWEQELRKYAVDAGFRVETMDTLPQACRFVFVKQ